MNLEEHEDCVKSKDIKAFERYLKKQCTNDNRTKWNCTSSDRRIGVKCLKVYQKLRGVGKDV